MLVLALAYVPVFVLLEVPEAPPTLRAIADVADYVIIITFALEFALRVAVADDRLRYLRTHWLDVLVILVPFLRPLRLVSVLWMLRVVAPILFMTRGAVAVRRIVRPGQGTYILLVGGLSVLLSSVLVWVSERGHGGSIHTLGDAMWWAFETITTVGYGDEIPVTPEGRIVAVFLMIVGIALFGLITASIAAYFVEEEAGSEQVEMKQLVERLEALESRLEEQTGLIRALLEQQDRSGR